MTWYQWFHSSGCYQEYHTRIVEVIGLNTVEVLNFFRPLLFHNCIRRGALGPIINRKTGQNFHQNRKTVIIITQNRKTAENNDPKRRGLRTRQGNNENRKTAFSINKNRKPNIKKRKKPKPQSYQNRKTDL